MKNKSQKCSRGHGSGVGHVADLRLILQRRGRRLKGVCFGKPDLQEPVGMRRMYFPLGKKNGGLVSVAAKKRDYERKKTNPFTLKEWLVSQLQKAGWF